MIKLKSVAAGFNVILGSYLTQLAAFLTLLLVIRKPPSYDDEERDSKAKWLFSFLVIYHLALAVFKYCITWLTEGLWNMMPFIMFGVVIMVTQLQQNWIYNEERINDEDKDTEQIRFEMWLFIELLMIGAYICGGALYLFMSKIKKPAFTLDTPTSSDNVELDNLDFIERNMFMIDTI